MPEGLFGLLKTMARVRGVTARAQPVRVEARSPAARAARRRARRPTMMQPGPVVLVERLEDDDLVARVQHGQQRRQHGLGGAAADRDVAVGVDVHAVELAGTSRRWRCRSRGVPQVIAYWWKSPSMARWAASISSRRRREVRHALGEVDAVVLVVDPGHLADDRLGEALDALGDHAARTTSRSIGSTGRPALSHATPRSSPSSPSSSSTIQPWSAAPRRGGC